MSSDRFIDQKNRSVDKQQQYVDKKKESKAAYRLSGILGKQNVELDNQKVLRS